MRRPQSICEAFGSLNTTHCVLRIDASSDQNPSDNPSMPLNIYFLVAWPLCYLVWFCIVVTVCDLE